MGYKTKSLVKQTKGIRFVRTGDVFFCAASQGDQAISNTKKNRLGRLFDGRFLKCRIRVYQPGAATA